MNTIQLNAPYLILVGDIQDPAYAKTGLGIAHWRPDQVAGQLRFPGCGVDIGVPDMSVEDAVNAGVKSLILGVAPVGGVLPESWLRIIVDAATAGLDIVCGLHIRLAEFPEVLAAAEKSGARLIDVRVPPKELPVGGGKKRQGRRVLMVGTDCAVGKKYSALSIHREMLKQNMNASFRATGQTGIMIAGSGIPIDAVPADFISGAAELASPDNTEDHWDVIEGQGSLFHPGYAAVSLGLLHGSQADAIVVCHDASRDKILGWPDYSVPTVTECLQRNVLEGKITNPNISGVGVCVNTSSLSADERSTYLNALSEQTGLPCVDPIATGCSSIVQKIQSLKL